MTLHCGPSISVYKATTLPSTLPSTLARDFNNKNTNNNEIVHERRSIQSLIDSSKKPPYARIDTILTNFFPEEYGEGFYGMEVGDVSCRPTFLQKMDLDAVDKNSNPVLRTNHPNLLNLLDISVCGDKLFLHYERPGISLGKLHKSTVLDRVAVATICKKLLHGMIYIHEALNVSHGHLHCGGIYLSDEGEIKIGDVGKSMTQRGKAKDLSRDVQAVFQIASGHSIWRTSNGDCNTEPKIIPLQLLLAVPEPLKIVFSDNAPLATWPGVQGISASGGVNYVTPLFLAWAYILSAKWLELLGHSSSHTCKLQYLDGTPSQSTLRFHIDYEMDEDENRWWKAVLSFGWKITTNYEGRAYLSPWSVTACDTPFPCEEIQLIDSNTPSCQTAFAYITRFCMHYGLQDQSSAALAAALYIPSLSGSTVLLPMLKNPTKPGRLPRTVLAHACSDSFSEHAEFLPYYMKLSCNAFGMRSLLCSTFFNADIECNLVSAWLEPSLVMMDPLIKGEAFTKLATLLGYKQPHVAALWLGAIIVGMAKPTIRDIRIGLVALDLHAAAWTSTDILSRWRLISVSALVRSDAFLVRGIR